MKEYKTAKKWAIFIYVFAPLLMGLFGWLLIHPLLNGNPTPNTSWILFPIAIAMITLMIIGIIEGYRGRLIIEEDSIKSISIFLERELKFSEIKGYTVSQNYIFIVPNVEGKKRIAISKYISDYNGLLSWLSKTFHDLDEQNAIEEEQKILHDENLGGTKEIRGGKLSKARQTSQAINWAGGMAAAWIFFYPTPYQYALLTAILIPIIALLAVKFSGGLIKVDEKKGSAFPSVIHAFIYPSIMLTLRAILDFEVFDHSNVWMPTIAIAAIFLAIIFINQQEINFKQKSDYLSVGSLILFLFAYGFGTVLHVNCYYDNSEPQHFSVKVIDKRDSSGRYSTSYYLKLATWGQQNKEKEVSVNKKLYNRTEIGNDMNLYFMPGKLDIPWFTVTDE